MKKILFALVIFSALTPLWPEKIQISQIDTTNLLFKGEFNIYFSLSGEEKKALTTEDFSVTEKSTGTLEIKNLKNQPNKDAGIDFILLIDNSGSMYEESYQGSLRITQARLALNSFLDQIENSDDRAAVFAFNTSLQEIAPFGTAVPEIRRSLSAIRQPVSEEAYTELYNSLGEVTRLFPKTSGRRAVIVLSDGENYSLFQHGGIETGNWGKEVAGPEEIIQTYLQTGITLDGINIADEMDNSLKEICSESGGKFHDVRSTEEISRVYTDIREKITNEYMLTVKASPLPGSTGEIRLKYEDDYDSRILLVPVLFGGMTALPLFISLLLLISGVAGIGALYFISLDKPVKQAQIQSLESNQRTILSNDVTVIGASTEAHYTIAGNPGIDAQHATIVKDEESGAFTLVSQKAVRVNNTKVKKRILTPGDVIRIEGATIIFDEPEDTKI